MTTTHPRPVADRVHGLGPTRARVLGTLQDVRVPATAAEVAERLGIHPNTARFHLDALVGSGLADRAREDRRKPGRPQVRYTAARSAPQTAHRSYRLLAEILARHLAAHTSDPHAEGIAAGRDYGRLLALTSGLTGAEGPAQVGHEIDPAQAISAVVETLDELGFESQPPVSDADTRSTTTVEVTSCPFLEVAEGHLEVVCAVHRGLMDGMLDELGTSARVDRLDPLVGPSRCVARFTNTPRRGLQTASRSAPR